MSTRASTISSTGNAGAHGNTLTTNQNHQGMRTSAWTIGLPVQVKTTTGDTIEGRIFAYDVVCGCLIIDIL
jgi:hypothetical protein